MKKYKQIKNLQASPYKMWLIAVIGCIGITVFGAYYGITTSAMSDKYIAYQSRIGETAPYTIWTRQFGTGGTDRARGVAVDTTGNIYIAGETSASLPGQTSLGSNDAFLRRYDAEGNEVWTRQFGTNSVDSGYAADTDPEGNIYVVGDTVGTFPGQTSSGGTDAFVRKYDAEGNVLWTRQLGTDSTDRARGVAVDASGNVYVAGQTGGSFTGQTNAGSDDIYVRKYDTDGNEIWTRQFGTTSFDWASSIAVDTTGNIYMTGDVGGTLPDHSSLGFQDSFVRKYSADGSVLWTRQFGTNGNDNTRGIAVDQSGNSYVAGYTNGSFPGFTRVGLEDAFIRKYDADGAEVWTRQFGTASADMARSVAVDTAGNSYVVGDTNGTLPEQTRVGSVDSFIRKYNPEGNFVWTRQFGTTDIDETHGIAVDILGNSYVAGAVPRALPGQTGLGGYDAFAVKYSNDLPTTPTPTPTPSPTPTPTPSPTPTPTPSPTPTPTPSPTPTPASAAPFDFDGDGRTDVSIFRPGNGQWWQMRSSDGENRAFTFGTATDVLVPGDYTGDGKTDVAFFRPSTGMWYVLRSGDTSFYAFPFGSPTDIPVPADYDGDGKTDAAVYRPSNGTWYILRSTDGGVSYEFFGGANDRPVPADYDGDGKADVAIVRPTGSTGLSEWWIKNSSDGGNRAFLFGTATDRAVPGDYTGDGKADVAYFRPSTGTWYILRSENLTYYAFPFGAPTDLPTPGDYDGDGRFDAAVYRPSNGTWFVNQTTEGIMITSFGASTDMPIPYVFVR
ncbi:MAG: SBBP repeat-containing protein [Acidobacteria bacterium]|nr:SBBP repeat-containing protein [Acidobacteriota bacterium]